MSLRVFGTIMMLCRLALFNPHRVIQALSVAVTVNSQLLRARMTGQFILIVYVDHAEFWPIVEPVWNRLDKDLLRRTHLVVATRNGAVERLKQVVQNSYHTPNQFVSGWALGLLRHYDLFLTTHQSAVAPIQGDGPRVCLFHGLPNKGATFVETQWRFLDGAFLLGPLQERLFEEFRARHPTMRRLWGRRVGYPKSDAMYTASADAKDQLEDLGLDPRLPTVLYAPTWEEGGSLRTQGLEIAERLLEIGGNVVVKLHPMSYYPMTEIAATGGVDWSVAFEPLEANSRFRHVKGGDATVLLNACDILVTDGSSIAFEAILMDRPIVFVDAPQLFDATIPMMSGLSPHEARNDLRYNSGRQAGPVATSGPELVEHVSKLVNDPSAFSAERARIRSQLLFNQGSAAAVCAEEIRCLLVGGDDTIMRCTS